MRGPAYYLNTRGFIRKPSEIVHLVDACTVGWVNLDNPLLQPPRNLFMDSRNMPEKHRRIPIMGSATVSLLKIAIFTTYGMK